MRTGEMRTNRIAATNPLNAEAVVVIASAFFASPFYAIGYPSSVVAAADSVPGAFNRTAEMLPPNIAPL